MMARRRPPSRRPRTGRQLDPEMVERLIDGVLQGGPDRARQLEKTAGSEAEAEVVRLVNAIREVGDAQVPIPDSQVDEIMAAVREGESPEARSLRRSRRVHVLATGLGSGATLWYGLTQLDKIVFSAPANRGAVLLVAICGALVCLLLDRRVQARSPVPGIAPASTDSG